jgi:hypothetical protein
MLTKKEINNLAVKKYKNMDNGLFLYNGFVEGYTEAQKEMAKYKKAFDILNCYFDSISDEEKPKVSKQLTKLGL